jgi:hypothetical protein
MHSTASRTPRPISRKRMRCTVCTSLVLLSTALHARANCAPPWRFLMNTTSRATLAAHHTLHSWPHSLPATPSARALHRVDRARAAEHPSIIQGNEASPCRFPVGDHLSSYTSSSSYTPQLAALASRHAQRACVAPWLDGSTASVEILRRRTPCIVLQDIQDFSVPLMAKHFSQRLQQPSQPNVTAANPPALMSRPTLLTE